MNKYRWLKLAGITNELQDLVSEGTVTFPQNAVELLALLAFQEKYEADAHPVVATWFRTNHKDNTKVLGQIKREVEEGGTEESGTHRLVAPQFAKNLGRLTPEEDELGKDGKYEKSGKKANVRTVDGEYKPAKKRGFKASQIPFQSQGGGSDQYVEAGEGTTNISFGPLSGETQAKRGGDKEIAEDLKWSDEFAEKVKTAVKDALPPAPEGYQLVNIAQHQHGNGHPDVLLIWQKAAKDSTENKILSFSSYRDKFADYNNPTEAELEKLNEEIKEQIDGVQLWPIHVKTGTTARFSAIAQNPNMVTTGSAIESILGSTETFQQLSDKLSPAWRAACQAPKAAVKKTKTKAAQPAVPGGSVKDAKSKEALKTALDGFKDLIMEWFDEKFRVTQYELRITGVTSFAASKDREEVKELSDRNVKADLVEYDTKPLINRSSVTVEAGSSKTAKLSFVTDPEFKKRFPSVKSRYKLTINANPSGNRVDLNDLPKIEFSEPEELKLAITQNWGTTLNVEDFVTGEGEEAEYNWEAIEALFGTPFDQVEEDGVITSTEARPPMKDHGWLGAAINHPDVKRQKVTLNTLVSNGRLSREFLKDCGLMEQNYRYSIASALLIESPESRAKRKAELKRKRTKRMASRLKDNKAAAYMIDNPSNAAKFEKEADLNSDGMVTNNEFEKWEMKQSRLSDPRYNPSAEQLANAAGGTGFKAPTAIRDDKGNIVGYEDDGELGTTSGEYREFEGEFVNLPTGITPDTELSIEDIFVKIIEPAMDKMELKKGAAFDKYDKDVQDRFTSAVTSTLSSSDGFKVKKESAIRKYSIADKLL